MAVIYSYPPITSGDLNFADKLILSKMNVNGNPTKSVSLGELRNFINPTAGGGSVQGVGTTDYLPIWTDGPNSVLGDSIVKFDFGNEIRIEGKLIVDDEVEIDGSELIVNGSISADSGSVGEDWSVGEELRVFENAVIGNVSNREFMDVFSTSGVVDICADQWKFSEDFGGTCTPRFIIDSQLNAFCPLEMFGNDIIEVNLLQVPYGDAQFGNDVFVDGKVYFGSAGGAVDPFIEGVGSDLLFESNGTKYFQIDDAAGKIEFSETVSTIKGLEATGKNFMPNLDLFADDAAAGAGGMAAGQLYQTDGTGAAPLNVKGIVMLKQ